MSLRERLEAKARRRFTIQVAVEDTTEAQKRLHDARMERLAGMASNRPEVDTSVLDAAITDAEAALDALYADVVIQAMQPGDFEALVDAHTTDEGDIDRAAFLPPALAASAEDEDLQDEDWWAEQLARPTWTDGERALLFQAVHALNDPSVRAAAVPKG